MSIISVPIIIMLVCIALGIADGGATTSKPNDGVDDAYRISAPDIYPTDKVDYVGDVMVKMVANSPDCDVFYTRDGLTPTNQSRYYTSPFPIFEPGRWIVRAIAIPRSGSMFESVVKERFYNVLPAKVAAPVVLPPKGTYRGQVSVQLMPAPPVPEGAKVQFASDVEDPGDVWQLFDPNQPVVLDTPGEHVIIARTFIGDGTKADQRSPIARYRYIVTPTLSYDVSSECVKCEKKPTVGHTFTIYLQNAEPDSWLFLTTSRMGCENEKHMVDDTNIVRVVHRQVAYRFATYTDAEPRVFVCLKEPSTAPQGYKIVPRRAKTGGTVENSDGSFSIQPPVGNFQRVTEHETSPQYVTAKTYRNSGNASSGTFPLLAFGILFFAVMGAAYVVLKFSSVRNPHQRRQRVPTQEEAEMASRTSAN